MDIKDNFEETLKEINQFILSYLPNLNLDLETKNNRIIKDLTSERINDSKYLEFRKAGTDITLNVDYDRVEGSDGLLEIIKNDNGDLLVAYSLVFRLNWPCHGSVNEEVAIERLGFYTDVALLAKELKVKFGPIKLYQLVATGEERKAEERKRKIIEDINKITNILKENNKGMRVGGNSKYAVDPHLASALEKEYTIPVGVKEYKCTVSQEFSRMNIIRTK